MRAVRYRYVSSHPAGSNRSEPPAGEQADPTRRASHISHHESQHSSARLSEHSTQDLGEPPGNWPNTRAQAKRSARAATISWPVNERQGPLLLDGSVYGSSPSRRGAVESVGFVKFTATVLSSEDPWTWIFLFQKIERSRLTVTLAVIPFFYPGWAGRLTIFSPLRHFDCAHPF